MKDNKHVRAIPQGVLTQAQTKINEAVASASLRKTLAIRK
jgi:hypothetical protein